MSELAAQAREEKLPDAFITCNAASPRYWVEIKTSNLKDAQKWHDAILKLAKVGR